MSGHIIHASPIARGALPSTRRVPASGWVKTVARMARAIEERRVLATLDDRMLSDIGLNRLEATREAARAPWDLTQRG